MDDERVLHRQEQPCGACGLDPSWPLGGPSALLSCCSPGLHERSAPLPAERIVNPDDEAVREVEDSREWPTSVAEYAAMMRPDVAAPIKFTKGGDSDVVTFNFYRMCFGLSHSFFPDLVAARTRSHSRACRPHLRKFDSHCCRPGKRPTCGARRQPSSPKPPVSRASITR